MSSKNQEPTDNQENIIIYQSDDGLIKLKTKLNNETVWLTQKSMAELFGCSTDNISLHLKNIFASGELDENSVTEISSITAADGKNYKTKLYNLDAIISVGYRINSTRATQFRIWATKVLKEYIVKGFALDDDRLKNRAGDDYWKELLGRIRDIRSSEKMLYRQVLDLYATSVDYDPKSKESIKFFKIVQNKLHYATHGHTAAEVIYERADAKKPFMGLTTFSGKFPTLSDAKIAKNYLNESELKVLNNLVSGYFDLAEISAIEHKPMYMKDYIEKLDTILSSSGRELLNDAGKISREKALEKATKEYRKFELENPSPVEEAYLESLTSLEKQVKKKTE